MNRLPPPDPEESRLSSSGRVVPPCVRCGAPEPASPAVQAGLPLCMACWMWRPRRGVVAKPWRLSIPWMLAVGALMFGCVGAWTAWRDDDPSRSTAWELIALAPAGALALLAFTLLDARRARRIWSVLELDRARLEGLSISAEPVVHFVAPLPEVDIEVTPVAIEVALLTSSRRGFVVYGPTAPRLAVSKGDMLRSADLFEKWTAEGRGNDPELRRRLCAVEADRPPGWIRLGLGPFHYVATLGLGTRALYRRMIGTFTGATPP